YNFASQLYGQVDFGLFMLFVAREARKNARAWAEHQGIDDLTVGQVYTPILLKCMCIGYVEDLFGHTPINGANIVCLSTEYFEGISSPAHPTSMVEYGVSVPTAHGMY